MAWIKVELVAGIGVWLMTRLKALSMKEFVNFYWLLATEFNSGKQADIRMRFQNMELVSQSD